MTDSKPEHQYVKELGFLPTIDFSDSDSDSDSDGTAPGLGQDGGSGKRTSTPKTPVDLFSRRDLTTVVSDGEEYSKSVGLSFKSALFTSASATAPPESSAPKSPDVEAPERMVDPFKVSPHATPEPPANISAPAPVFKGIKLDIPTLSLLGSRKVNPPARRPAEAARPRSKGLGSLGMFLLSSRRDETSETGGWCGRARPCASLGQLT